MIRTIQYELTVSGALVVDEGGQGVEVAKELARNLLGAGVSFSANMHNQHGVHIKVTNLKEIGITAKKLVIPG